MALEMLEKDDSDCSVWIFVDNRAAIRFSVRLKNQAGQYLLRRIVELHHTLNRDFTLQWIFAQEEGVLGNEAADREATGWREHG